MDSGNSGSLQSSSGGDDEYDSRAAGSIFMNTHVLGPISNPPPPQFSFDPFSNYMQVHQPNMPWPRPTLFRSDPNSTTHRDINNNSMFLAGSSHLPPPLRPPPGIGEVNNGSSSSGFAPPVTNHSAAARNPRKRSRASRRAPTTVLTTDTTNFRAMVQEFTGVPAAPPFINNSLFRGSGLDLFGTRSASFEAPQPPPYLRRPSVQKDQSPPQFLASSSTAPDGGGGIGGSSTANNNNNISPVSSTLSTQSWNLFNNVPNPLVTSLNQTNSSSNTSDQTATQNDCCNNNNITDHNKNAAARRWSNNNGVMNPADHEDDDYTPRDNRMKTVVGSHNFSMSMMNNGKMNYSGEKGPPENIAIARGSEGMVESWINCSSSE